VLGFWFGTLTRADWFAKSDELDRTLAQCFAATYDAVSVAPLANLLTSANEALAAVIVLDQIPRNIFRGTPRAFAADARARDLTRAAIAAGHDLSLGLHERLFLYLPLEHSEVMADQDSAVDLISALGDAEYTRYAIAHRAIIVRFGRFPHRNAILGRASTPEETAFLEQPGSSF
jgi:uncharacterized protein (DUF924 family)